MHKRFFSVLIFFFFVVSVFINAQVPTPKGLWKFDDANNLTKADVGNPLELVGTQKSVTGPSASNGAAEIGVGSYYKMTHGIAANGGGALVNEFTLQIDFKVSSYSDWHCFFQTSPTNSNDGDCFINTSGYIGVSATGYSSYIVRPNEWYRLVVSVKNGTQYKTYLDGQLLVSSSAQAIDGRFALDKQLLLFADEDGEDGIIQTAEVAIWETALSASQISSLGGYGHYLGTPPTRQLILVPYLQNPSPTSLFVCWHDTLSTVTKVEYGTTQSLGQSTEGTSEVVADVYRWHTVKLTGLNPNTQYYYRVVSGSGASQIYSFKTWPGTNYNGKLRFLLLSDTHSSDTTMAVKVIKEAKKKMQQLYGDDIQNNMNLVLHSGDLVVTGSIIKQWTDEYFAPMSPISPYIPFLTVTGNHEGENQNYYKYMQYDDISGYPPPNSFTERFWATVVGNIMIVGLNTNLSGAAQTLQNLWLDAKLKEAEDNSAIDFVFLIGHHFELSELWGEGMTEGVAPAYVKNQIFPILKKYSKVIQYSYGHTHGFERGTVESLSGKNRNDYRIVCGGGGGGATDRWGAYKNQDFNSIHVTLDHYFYQLIEIDVANKTFESKMYSLGNGTKWRDNQLMDSWYIKVNQPAPSTPTLNLPVVADNKVQFSSSKISGDSLMTVRIQISLSSDFSKNIVDSMFNWKDIYGVTSAGEPIDKNKGIDLTKLSFSLSNFAGSKTYYSRIKYRDHNLKWSEWSTAVMFNTPTAIEITSIPIDYELGQNYPNPFNPRTLINYQIPKEGHVSLKVFNLLGKEIATLVNEKKQPGRYQVEFDMEKLEKKNLPSGVYLYRIQTDDFSETKKLLLLK